MNNSFGKLSGSSNFSDAADWFVGAINLAIPVIFGIVLVFLIWKMIDSWIIHGGDEQKVIEGKQYAFTAVIVLVAMVSIWGIVKLISGSIFGG